MPNDIPAWEETSEIASPPPSWEETLPEEQAQALDVATTAPLEMTSRVNRAWGVGEASMQPPEPVPEPPRRRAIVTRAGVREVPPGEFMPGEKPVGVSLEETAQAIPPGKNFVTRPLFSLAKTGLGFAAGAMDPKNLPAELALATPLAPAAEGYFAYQMGKGAVKSVNDIIELMGQTGPVDEAWKQKMSDAIVNAEAAGVGTVAAGVGAKRGGAELIRQARARLAASGARAVPPGLPPRGTVRTRTGTTTFDYDPAAAPAPPRAPAPAPAPKPAAVPLATPEAEAAEQARLAAELGQEEEVPAEPKPAAPGVSIPVYATDELTMRTGEKKLDLGQATKITKIVNDSGKEVYAIQYQEDGEPLIAYTDDPIVELHDKYAGESPAYAKEFEALKKGKAAPAAAKVTPADLEPALLVNGKPVTGGASHEEIMRNALATADDPVVVAKAFADDKTHVFVDKSGKVYTRREAADALGEEKNLHSERLAELKKKAAPALPETAAGERALAQQIDKSAEAQTPPTPTYTGADATLILGKPLGYWFTVTDEKDLPKGSDRKAFAKRIGVANKPAKILAALKNSQRRIREIVSPPLSPEDALPATAAAEEKAPKSPEEMHNVIAGAMQQVRKDLEAQGWKWDPQWGPLELVLKPEWLDAFMFMGSHPHPTMPGRTLYEYKHGITRRYLRLDDEGGAYGYNYDGKTEAETYPPIPLEQAIDRVYEGIEKQGETRESKYNEDYIRRKNEALIKAGFAVSRTTPEGTLTSVPKEKAPAPTTPAPSQIPSELPSESKETTPESVTPAIGSEPSVVGPSPNAPEADELHPLMRAAVENQPPHEQLPVIEDQHPQEPGVFKVGGGYTFYSNGYEIHGDVTEVGDGYIVLLADNGKYLKVVSPAKPLTEITQTPYPEKFNSVKELIDFRNKRRQEEVALYQEQIGLTKEQAETLQQLLADGRSTSKFEKKLSPEVRQRLNKFFEESPLNQKDSPFEFWDFDKNYNPEELLSEDDPKYLSSALFSAIADRVPESPTSDKFIYAAVAASKLREMGLDQRDLARLLDEHARRSGGNEEYFKLIAGRLKTFLDRQGIQFPETKRPALPEPAAAAVPAEKAKEPQTSVDVPDLANQAVTLGRRVDLDSGEKREIGRAIEAARKGNPAELIAWVEKLKGLAAPKERVVKGVKFGGTGERAQDLITWLEGNFPGGIRITSKGDFGRYVKEATGAARKLLFMDKGEYVDNVMKAAELDGLGPWRSQDEFLGDVLRSASGRTTTGERLSAEEKILEDEAAQVEAFQQTALRNRGRTAEERKAAGKGIPVNSLNVGDTFTIKGQQVVVAEVDPYGDVLLDGGKRFGAQRLSDGQTIYPDNGQVTKAPEEGFGPGAASVAEFRSRENRRRILADMTAYLFGDRAGEVADALLRKLAGEAVPKTMALSGESGNKMVRFASATTAGPHMARAQAREVLGDHFQDRAFRRRLGAVLVEDRLRAIRRGFLQAARDATDPAEQARLQQQANDVNTLVGPGRVFDSEAAFRAALRDPEIAAAIERHKQGPQYEAELYHTTADGVLAGPGVNTGAFINLAPIYESEPSAIFTSSRKGDYTRPFKRRSVFSRRAAGTADVYELDYEPLVERMLRGNYEEYTKRELYDQLVSDRLAAVLPPGEPRPTFDGRPGEKFQIKRQTLVTTAGGQTRIIPQYENLWVHPSVAAELRQAEHIGSPINNVALARTAAVINRIQLALGTDAVWHIGNMFSKIAGSQGGENLLIDLGRKVPLANVVDAITRLTISSRRILQNDPEVLNQIAELSQTGNVRADIPERGRVSRLINLLDKAGRVVLDDFYKNLVNRGLVTASEAGRREWNSQLGQYNPRLMGQLESFFKEAGISPFIVAARNFNRAAVRKMVLSPGIRAANMRAALEMRAVEAFGVVATLFAVPFVINSFTVHSPLGRPGVPVGAIDTGKDDANGKHIYIDPAQWIGLRRGMRITGVNALLEGMLRGQPARQIKKQAAHDIIGAIAHPWAGPIVQMGSVLGTGYTTSFFKESKDPGDYWENFKAALKQINPVVHGYFQRQGKGVVGGLQSSLTTFAGAAGVKSRAPLSAVNQIHDLANGWASRSSDARIRSEYEQHAKEDFSSPYQELRSALIRKDLQGARDAYRELREKGKKPSVIAETLRRPHPFTGSARSENMFKASLSDKERALYKQAEDERRQLYQAFRQMLNSQ